MESGTLEWHYGLWTMDYGVALWSGALWSGTMDYGLWTLEWHSGVALWTMDYGLWTMEWQYGIWTTMDIDSAESTAPRSLQRFILLIFLGKKE